MKKSGVLNVQLAGYIAGLGHKETFMVADAGMPIPRHIPIIDLALCGGVPTFIQGLDAVLEETIIRSYTIASEIMMYNEVLFRYINEKLANVESEIITHNQLKERSNKIKFVVRTGDFSPYSNIILEAGVAF